MPTHHNHNQTSGKKFESIQRKVPGSIQSKKDLNDYRFHIRNHYGQIYTSEKQEELTWTSSGYILQE